MDADLDPVTTALAEIGDTELLRRDHAVDAVRYGCLRQRAEMQAIGLSGV